MPKQQTMSEFVASMETAGMLVRITDETRVDQIPLVMEANPTKAVLIENVKDCEFQYLGNAYSNQDQYAWAMECDKTETGVKMVETAKGRFPTTLVETAPCKEVILTGDDVDLSILPMYLHHDRDGHVYTNDDFVISKSPRTGVPEWGIYRSMWRTKNEKLFDMTCTSHRARLNAMAAAELGQDLEIAVVLGGPIVDHVAALAGVPPETNDFEVLGAFYGESAKMVKCETVDLEVPANAEIVLEGKLKAVEGLIWDEGPYGEFTGMYGGGIKHNFRFEVTAITYRKGGIYQYATIGGEHPWYTDNMLQLPAIEADLFSGLQLAGIDVTEVRCPLGGLSNIAYAKIRPRGAGDSKQALGVMLTCSKQALPKVAMVFDEDVDIWDDQAVLAAMAFRYAPHRGTVLLPPSNTMTVDPAINDLLDGPGTMSKLGIDCTIPIGPGFRADSFTKSRVPVFEDPPADLDQLSEEELTADMRAFIEEAPRTWRDIYGNYIGQNYQVMLRSFGNLRHELGRVNAPPLYPYTFSDSPFVGEEPPPVEHNRDPRHMEG